jgi:hypothetical protein
MQGPMITAADAAESSDPKAVVQADNLLEHAAAAH